MKWREGPRIEPYLYWVIWVLLCVFAFVGIQIMSNQIACIDPETKACIHDPTPWQILTYWVGGDWNMRIR